MNDARKQNAADNGVCSGIAGSATLMDAKGDPSPATNYDGTPVIIEGEWVRVKELYCPSGCGCGGCMDRWEDYKIGDGRFFWQNKVDMPSCLQ